MNRQHMHAASGFTLIEIMITVGIIAIVGAIAFPAYEKQAQKSRRADGIALLMDAAAREERFVVDNNRYTDEVVNAATHATDPGLGMSADSQKGYYTLSIALGTPAYTLTATAQNGQENDVCKNLTLTSTGVRSASASSNCW